MNPRVAHIRANDNERQRKKTKIDLTFDFSERARTASTCEYYRRHLNVHSEYIMRGRRPMKLRKSKPGSTQKRTVECSSLRRHEGTAERLRGNFLRLGPYSPCGCSCSITMRGNDRIRQISHDSSFDSNVPRDRR